jgi:heme A synthase
MEPVVAVDERADIPAILTVMPLDEPEIATIPRGAERALPFAIALLASTLTYWTIDILSPALPAIQNDLALSAAGTGLVFSLLFLGRLVANLPAAILVDRLERREPQRPSASC